MDKIFHVFVSSTYDDLIDERKKVSEAVAKAGYVAEGMEIFPASSQTQMDFIRRVIDRCDYYILIMAGRYGTISDSGLSYTELEFCYAQSKGIPILAFLRRNIDDLPKKYLESDELGERKLGDFKERLRNQSVIDHWTNPDELSTRALAALSQARITHEGTGWIRADRAASEDILAEINELRKKNAELSKKVQSFGSETLLPGINVAGLDEIAKIKYTKKIDRMGEYEAYAELTWREILGAIGSKFRTPSNTSKLSDGLERLIRDVDKISKHSSIKIDFEVKERILMQMEALGMMTGRILALQGGGSAVFHQLTDKGLRTTLAANVTQSTAERN